MCLDEIQTGFWQPEVFEFRTLGLQPDLVVLGKGLTAGFHPLSGVLDASPARRAGTVRRDQHERLGRLAGVCGPVLAGADRSSERRRSARSAGASRKDSRRWWRSFRRCCEAAHGRGHLAGLKFHEVEDAKRFPARCCSSGLWTRVHAYHEGHRTLLTKLGLLADDDDRGFCAGPFPEAAQERPVMNAAVRPKVGLLALTLELYETLAPGLRASREAWLRQALIPALAAVRGCAVRRGRVPPRRHRVRRGAVRERAAPMRSWSCC